MGTTDYAHFWQILVGDILDQLTYRSKPGSQRNKRRNRRGKRR